MSPVSPVTLFSQLPLDPALVAALEAHGVTEPFPIQAATLPDSLAGRDVLGRGRTGSGKTLAFGLPLLTRTKAAGRRAEARRPLALVLVPTRELAGQVFGAIFERAQYAAWGLGLVVLLGFLFVQAVVVFGLGLGVR